MRENRNSDSGFGERNLYFAAWKHLIMKMCNGLEAILHGVELDQRHIFLIGVAKNLDCLNFPIISENLV